MHKISLSLLVVASTLVFAGGSQAIAGVIYDNGGPDQQSGNETTQWVQTEDFSVKTSTTLTDAHFWTVEGEWDGTLNWYVFADNGGQPGAAPLASGTGTNVVKTATGNSLFFGTEYEYSFDLDSPVAVTGGTDYWFGLHLSSNFDRDEIYWETTTPGFGSDGVESNGGTFDNWFNNGQQHAFYLTDDTARPVPEPSTLALLGIALAGLSAIRRRRESKGADARG